MLFQLITCNNCHRLIYRENGEENLEIVEMKKINFSQQDDKEKDEKRSFFK